MASDSGSLTRAALSNRAVRAVVGSVGLTTLGEWLLGTAVAIYAYEVGGALAVGLVGFRFFPAALAGLFAAPLGDRYRRDLILTWSNAARAAACGAAALCVVAGLPFGALLALVWLDAALGAAFRPAQVMLIPQLVRSPGELTAATVLASNAKSASQVLGALGGGVLIAVVDPAIAVAAAGAAQLWGALLTTRVRGPKPPGAAGPWRGELARVWLGAAALASDRDAERVVRWACVRALMRGLWVALGVVACLELLDLGESGFGVLMAFAGVGTLLGIPLNTALVGRRGLGGPFAAGLALIGLPIALIGVFASGPAAFALLVGYGIGMAVADVGAAALLNRVVGSQRIGHITGLQEALKYLAEALGALLAPALVALFGIQAALIVAGGLVPLGVLLDLRGFRATDRRAIGSVDRILLIRAVALFAPLRLDGLEAVAARLTPAAAAAGTAVVQQDRPDAGCWYLIESGTADVEVDGYLIGELSRGASFGERGLLRAAPRSATVRARDDLALLTLDRDGFLAAVTGAEGHELDADQGPRDLADALARQPLLAGIDRGPLLAAAAHRTVAAGANVYAAGDAGDAYYVILAGTATVLVADAPRRTLHPGDAFGEIAVLHRVPRTATVRADDRLELGVVPADALRAALAGHGGALGALAGERERPVS